MRLRVYNIGYGVNYPSLDRSGVSFCNLKHGVTRNSSERGNKKSRLISASIFPGLLTCSSDSKTLNSDGHENNDNDTEISNFLHFQGILQYQAALVPRSVVLD